MPDNPGADPLVAPAFVGAQLGQLRPAGKSRKLASLIKVRIAFACANSSIVQAGCETGPESAGCALYPHAADRSFPGRRRNQTSLRTWPHPDRPRGAYPAAEISSITCGHESGTPASGAGRFPLNRNSLHSQASSCSSAADSSAAPVAVSFGQKTNQSISPTPPAGESSPYRRRWAAPHTRLSFRATRDLRCNSRI